MIILMEPGDPTIEAAVETFKRLGVVGDKAERSVIYSEDFLKEKERNGTTPTRLTFLGHGRFEIDAEEGTITKVAYRSHVAKDLSLTAEVFIKQLVTQLKQQFGDNPLNCPILNADLIGCQLGKVSLDANGKPIYSIDPTSKDYCFAMHAQVLLREAGYNIQVNAFSNLLFPHIEDVYALTLTYDSRSKDFSLIAFKSAYELPGGPEIVKEIEAQYQIKFAIDAAKGALSNAKKQYIGFERKFLDPKTKNNKDVEEGISAYFKATKAALEKYIARVENKQEAKEIKGMLDQLVSLSDKYESIKLIEDFFKAEEEVVDKKLKELKEKMGQFKEKHQRVLQTGIKDFREVLDGIDEYHFSERVTATSKALSSVATMTKSQVKEIIKKIEAIPPGDVKAQKAFLKAQVGEEVPDKKAGELVQKFLIKAKAQLAELRSEAKATKVVTAPRGSIAAKASSTLLTPSTNPLTPTVTKPPKK